MVFSHGSHREDIAILKNGYRNSSKQIKALKKNRPISKVNNPMPFWEKSEIIKKIAYKKTDKIMIKTGLMTGFFIPIFS